MIMKQRENILQKTKEERGRCSAKEKENSVRTFSYYCNGWLSANTARLKESSLLKYERDMEKHIKPFFGSRKPCDINSDEVDSFTKMLLYDQNLSPGTVRNILVLLHSVFEYMKKRTEYPLPEPEIIYPRESRRTVRVMDKQEEEMFMRFLAAEMDLYKFGIYTALRTGMRIGEICALKWRDISFGACTISIRHTAQRIRNTDETNDAKTRVMIGTPKTDSSCRVIPLMPDIAGLCARFYAGGPEAFVLTGTERCMEPRKLQRKLKIYTEKCGIEAVHFHTLRHTFATRCIDAGFDVKTLSEILGHSNIGITMNQYVHPDMETKRANMSRLKTILSY